MAELNGVLPHAKMCDVGQGESQETRVRHTWAKGTWLQAKNAWRALYFGEEELAEALTNRINALSILVWKDSEQVARAAELKHAAIARKPNRMLMRLQNMETTASGR
jgi:hypothetical protein